MCGRAAHSRRGSARTGTDDAQARSRRTRRHVGRLAVTDTYSPDGPDPDAPGPPAWHELVDGQSVTAQVIGRIYRLQLPDRSTVVPHEVVCRVLARLVTPIEDIDYSGVPTRRERPPASLNPGCGSTDHGRPSRSAVRAAATYLGRSGSIGVGGGVPGRHGRPGPRSVGVGTRSAFFSRGTLVKRRVLVGGGDRAAARAAGRAGLCVTLRTGVLFDVVGVRSVGRGGLLRACHRFGVSYNAILRRGSLPLLSENRF